MHIRLNDIREALKKVKTGESEFKPTHRRAAVLVPIIQSGSSLDILLTRRTDLVEHHKNQISFPGGVSDGDDESIIDTALRETYEELGIKGETIEILGELEQLTTPSGFHISPVVGYLAYLPVMHINPTEVTEVFTVPLDFFLEERHMRFERRAVEGKEYDIYFYHFGEKIIWGATAHMIRSLLRVVDKNKQ
jgi:8-oxo-dGTP pyrophosphatase MutT (NUDIX family)